MNRKKFDYQLIIAIITINTIFAFLSTPILQGGDQPAYISFSKSILGEETGIDFMHRSPLYSVIMAGMMLVFSPSVLFKAMIYLQYFMLSITTWLLYKIFRRLYSKERYAILSAILFNLSLSTIYYANMILTEILTVFLLVLASYIVVLLRDSYRHYRVFLLGLFVGLLCLARYNSIPLALSFIFMLTYTFVSSKLSWKKFLLAIFTYSFTFMLVINLWCLYNYNQYGLYRLFPINSSTPPRNALVSTIRSTDLVSDDNREIHRVFVEAREEYLSKKKIKLKGSFSALDKFDILTDLNSGFAIYSSAKSKLEILKLLPFRASESEVNTRLSSYYREVSKGKGRYFFKLRILSLLSSFRSSGSSLPEEYGKINTNILPSAVFKIHKMLMVTISIIVFLWSIIYIRRIFTRKNMDFIIVLSYVMIFSFWFINFYFVTVNDANRFKFPAEPFIFGLFMYICNDIHGYLITTYRDIIAKKSKLLNCLFQSTFA